MGARIEVRDPSIDPEQVVFMTPKGTEFRKESYKDGRYVLVLVGGKDHDGQEVYALYPKPEGGYYNFGKLLVVSYPSCKMQVQVVPVGQGMDRKEVEGLKEKLRSIYGRVGIDCEVMLDEVFPYDGSTEFFAKSSELLSIYTDEMKALNGAYEAARPTGDKTSVLFILGESGARKERNASGYMPRGGQFGYLFREDFRREEDFYVAAAHELGHGHLILRHTFDNTYQLSEGVLPENLMDYENGTHLAKWQWDIIHDPGVVVRLFEKDEESMSSWTIIDRKHTRLFNHIYKTNLEPYNAKNTDDFRTSDWQQAWTYGDSRPEELVDKVIVKLKNAADGETVPKITLRDFGIYIGKHEVGGQEWRHSSHRLIPRSGHKAQQKTNPRNRHRSGSGG